MKHSKVSLWSANRRNRGQKKTLTTLRSGLAKFFGGALSPYTLNHDIDISKSHFPALGAVSRRRFPCLALVFRGNEDEVTKGTSRRFSEVLGGPPGHPLRGRVSSRRLSVLLPLIVLPLNLSPILLCTAKSDFQMPHLRCSPLGPLDSRFNSRGAVRMCRSEPSQFGGASASSQIS